MKIIRIGDAYKIVTLVPRVFPNDGDVLVVKLRNEITNIESVIAHNWTYNNNYFTIELLEPEVGLDFYEVFAKYELTIIRNSSIIYRGKLEVICDQSIQDFKHTVVTDNKKIKF